ncbi:helix-turn-helix domain-containing protein [Deinococcus sp. RIT780]|uniref:helix-turn-helix domain-containing protein n=1 Tax=Deinococcus sp. RIT780 TaxID=2870472 RepID=UPI001C8A7DC1|nr:helix-turn-helix transcriptional regulator [Deinococcus sp. RIT780]MBX8464325.1 helix-turn-helix domain-containing protein [Deinococcus sp. RIT780]
MSEAPYALSQLKKLREQRGLTQGELSELAGVKLTTIQKHERGVQRTAALDVAAPLAIALAVPVEALFSVLISNEILENLNAREPNHE